MRYLLTSLLVSLGSILGCGSGPETLECQFYPVEEPTDRVVDCAYRDDSGNIVVKRETVEQAHFGDDGMASVMVEDKLHYLNRKGRTAVAFFYDNGADYFVEGLARTPADGRIGFVNKELDVVIPAMWDFAFPFDQGLAIVCNGCKSRQVDGGEHSEMVGGQWGYIDLKGEVVVPLDYRREELPSREAVSPSLREPPN